jgi:hypothetical protein
LVGQLILQILVLHQGVLEAADHQQEQGRLELLDKVTPGAMVLPMVAAAEALEG